MSFKPSPLQVQWASSGSLFQDVSERGCGKTTYLLWQAAQAISTRPSNHLFIAPNVFTTKGFKYYSQTLAAILEDLGLKNVRCVPRGRKVLAEDDHGNISVVMFYTPETVRDVAMYGVSGISGIFVDDGQELEMFKVDYLFSTMRHHMAILAQPNVSIPKEMARRLPFYVMGDTSGQENHQYVFHANLPQDVDKVELSSALDDFFETQLKGDWNVRTLNAMDYPTADEKHMKALFKASFALERDAVLFKTFFPEVIVP